MPSRKETASPRRQAESRPARADARPPEDHGHRPPDRPAPFGTRPRPAAPFRPGLRPGGDPPAPHSVRLQDGDRIVEVSGSPIFVRQVLDDLPSLWARLHGEGPTRPASIRMPQPPADDSGENTDRAEATE